MLAAGSPQPSPIDSVSPCRRARTRTRARALTAGQVVAALHNVTNSSGGAVRLPQLLQVL
jgi:hypothetical protein